MHAFARDRFLKNAIDNALFLKIDTTYRTISCHVVQFAPILGTVAMQIVDVYSRLLSFSSPQVTCHFNYDQCRQFIPSSSATLCCHFSFLYWDQLNWHTMFHDSDVYSSESDLSVRDNFYNYGQNDCRSETLIVGFPVHSLVVSNIRPNTLLLYLFPPPHINLLLQLISSDP